MQVDLGESLREANLKFENARNAVTKGMVAACDELEMELFEQMHLHGNSDHLSALLSFLWTDFYYQDLATPLVECATYGAIVCAIRSESWDNPRSPIHTLQERVFDVLWRQRVHVGSHLETLRIPLVGVCQRLQARGGLEWVQLANSHCCVWPDSTSHIFNLLSPRSGARSACIEYLFAIAYPTRDHPWKRVSTPLWERYCTHELPHFSGAALHALSALLTESHVRSRLEELADSETDKELAATLQEVLQLQLDTDFVRRRDILLDHLASNDGNLVWNDEWGMAD